jgi:hypothetical protein
MSNDKNERRAAFYTKLCADIEEWLEKPWSRDGNGGPYYKGDRKALRSFVKGLRSTEPRFVGFEGEDYLYFEAMLQYGDRVPLDKGLIRFLSEEEPYLPNYTSDRKMIYLYWYLTVKLGYEIRLIWTDIKIEKNSQGPSPNRRAGSCSDFCIKVR